MSKIKIISDIHIEMDNGISYDKIFGNTNNKHYILVIAGDLGHINEECYEIFLEKCSNNFKYVITVMGNHDYQVDNMVFEEIEKKTKKIFDKYDNTYLLNKDYIILDNYIFLGTTLWTHIPNIYSNIVKKCVSDYSNILTNNGIITTNHVSMLNSKEIEWLNNLANWIKNNQRDKIIICVTHHLPSFRLIPEMFTNFELNHAYANNDHRLYNLFNVFDYWIYGHSHYGKKIEIQKTLCISNPYGVNHDIYRNYNKNLHLIPKKRNLDFIN